MYPGGIIPGWEPLNVVQLGSNAETFFTIEHSRKIYVGKPHHACLFEQKLTEFRVLSRRSIRLLTSGLGVEAPRWVYRLLKKRNLDDLIVVFEVIIGIVL